MKNFYNKIKNTNLKYQKEKMRKTSLVPSCSKVVSKKLTKIRQMYEKTWKGYNYTNNWKEAI